MSQKNKKEYTGIDKYPALIATVLTVIVGAVFIGGLYFNAQGTHEGGEHAAPTGEHGAEAAPAGTEAPH